jgi:hypothetical protein
MFVFVSVPVCLSVIDGSVCRVLLYACVPVRQHEHAHVSQSVSQSFKQQQ